MFSAWKRRPHPGPSTGLLSSSSTQSSRSALSQQCSRQPSLQPDLNCCEFTSCMFILNSEPYWQQLWKFPISFGRIHFPRLNTLFPSGSFKWNNSKMAALAREPLSLSSGWNSASILKCICSQCVSPHKYYLTSCDVNMSHRKCIF